MHHRWTVAAARATAALAALAAALAATVAALATALATNSAVSTVQPAYASCRVQTGTLSRLQLPCPFLQRRVRLDWPSMR